MSSAQHYRSGSDPSAKADGKLTGFTVDAGPYEAVIVGHVKGTKSGQLEVFIPDWSARTTLATKDNPIIVSYASPFYGKTFGTDTEQLPETPGTSGQSYGMWMVPPDIGSKVLVTFVAGDMDRGYWFACIYDTPSHHMVPGLSRDVGGNNNTRAPQSAIAVSGDSILPVVEYNTRAPDAFESDAITGTPRFPHEYQASILVVQGLDRDPIRGAISSSSMRESPSNVYGISTPGRKITAGDQVPGDADKVIYRKGGHQFVMDDGDANGEDQLIRLRTSGGHQILMNDSENLLYIASNSGNHWLEFSNNGQINIYSRGGFNLRTEGVMNLHSDVSINMNAPIIKMNAVGNTKVPLGSFSAYSSGTMGLSSMGTASLKSNGMLSLSAIGKASLVAGGLLDLSSAVKTSVFGGMLLLNSGKPSIPFPVLPATQLIKDDTKLLGKQWAAIPGGLLTTVTVAPAHEPWKRVSK
jgi:hypothetical protein